MSGIPADLRYSLDHLWVRPGPGAVAKNRYGRGLLRPGFGWRAQPGGNVVYCVEVTRGDVYGELVGLIVGAAEGQCPRAIHSCRWGRSAPMVVSAP
jgi:hypothetical protein